MTFASAPWRALCGWALAASLCGCSSLPFFGDKDGAAKNEAPPAEAQAALYELDVEAPAPIKTLLLAYLDLSRFQNAPASDRITPAELDRLAAQAPAQARSLLETEGYFDADVKIAQSAGANGLQRIVLTVDPGPRVKVESVSIEVATPLAPRAPTREDAETDRLKRMRRAWTLEPGAPFRQPAWSSAKTAALGELRADGYPKADWTSTHARIDASAQTAALSVTVEGG
ncbi:MAG: hypothetical protein ABI364_00445, partial [Caldimonas sp.]